MEKILIPNMFDRFPISTEEQRERWTKESVEELDREIVRILTNYYRKEKDYVSFNGR